MEKDKQRTANELMTVGKNLEKEMALVSNKKKIKFMILQAGKKIADNREYCKMEKDYGHINNVRSETRKEIKNKESNMANVKENPKTFWKYVQNWQNKYI